MRWPYARRYMHTEWGVRRTVDVGGPAVQVDLGRLGITFPLWSKWC